MDCSFEEVKDYALIVSYESNFRVRDWGICWSSPTQEGATPESPTPCG